MAGARDYFSEDYLQPNLEKLNARLIHATEKERIAFLNYNASNDSPELYAKMKQENAKCQCLRDMIDAIRDFERSPRELEDVAKLLYAIDTSRQKLETALNTSDPSLWKQFKSAVNSALDKGTSVLVQDVARNLRLGLQHLGGPDIFTTCEPFINKLKEEEKKEEKKEHKEEHKDGEVPRRRSSSS